MEFDIHTFYTNTCDIPAMEATLKWDKDTGPNAFSVWYNDFQLQWGKLKKKLNKAKTTEDYLEILKDQQNLINKTLKVAQTLPEDDVVDIAGFKACIAISIGMSIVWLGMFDTAMTGAISASLAFHFISNHDFKNASLANTVVTIGGILGFIAGLYTFLKSYAKTRRDPANMILQKNNVTKADLIKTLTECLEVTNQQITAVESGKSVKINKKVLKVINEKSDSYMKKIMEAHKEATESKEK